MGKLWIIGDSFFTRCIDYKDTESGKRPDSNPSVGGKRLGSSSWTEHVATHMGLDAEYYHSFGGASNFSIVLGLDNIVDQPRFNIETDQVLCGFTTTVRQVYLGSNKKPFDRKLGILNEARGRLVGSQHMHQHDAHVTLFGLKLTKDKLNAHNQYQAHLYPELFDEYIQCMLIDGAITRAKQRGINIIPHVGFMDFPYWYDPGSVEQAFEWHNKEMFSVPSFKSVYKYKINLGTEEEQFERFHNHMSPESAKQYAQLFMEYYDKLG